MNSWRKALLPARRGALLALALLSLALAPQAAETKRLGLSARILTVSPDEATVVINRGRLEHVIPGGACTFHPNRGETEAKIEWDIRFATGVVESVADGRSIVKLTAIYEKLQPRDYCVVEADLPAALEESDLGRIALLDIGLFDRVKEAPLFTLAELIKDPSPKAADAIYDRLLGEILATPSAVIEEKYLTDKIRGGLFNGRTLREVFPAATRQLVEKFVECRAWFPGRHIGYDWLLIDAYANWAYTGAESGEGEKRRRLAEPFNTRGAGALREGRFEDALVEYNGAVAVDPGNGEGTQKIETVNRILENRRALEEDDKDVTTRHALGLEYFEVRLYGRALEELLKARELGDDSEETARYLGFAHAALDHFAEARAELEPLAARFRDDATIRNWLDFVRQNEILARQGPDVSAFKAIGDIRYGYGDYGEAIAQYNKALDLAPKDAEIWQRIAKTVVRRQARQQEDWAKEDWQKGEHDAARAFWAKALELCGTIQDAKAEQAIRRDMAAAMYGSSFYDEAIETYRQILAGEPDDAACFFEIARCYMGKRDFPAAVRWVENGLAKAPQESWGYDILGSIYLDVNDLGQAIAQFQKAVDILPTYEEPLFNLGLAYARQADYENAKASFRRALEIDLDDGAARNRLADVEAILEAQARLRTAPEDNGARFSLADALLKIGDADRAIGHLKEALKSPRDAARANAELGRSLLWQSKYREARAFLEEAFKLDPKPDLKARILLCEARLLLAKDPNDPKAKIGLGESSLYWEAYDDALSYFGQAQSLGADPETVFAKSELARRGQEAKKELDLASDAFGRAQFETASACAERALAIYRALGARRGEVNALLRIGWSLAAMFKNDDALRAYTEAGKAAEVLKDESITAAYLYSLGGYYAGVGEYEKALGYQTSAGERWHATGAFLNEAGSALPAIGSLKFRLGDAAGELESYERALAIQRKLVNPSGEASVLINTAAAHDLQGDFSKAIELYQKALAIAQKHAFKMQALSAYAGLGSIYRTLGDVPNAQKYGQRYLDTAIALGYKSERANALNGLGLVDLEMTKDYGKALAKFQESLSLARLTGYRLMEGIAAANIALVYSRQGKYREALPRHEEAMRIIREAKEKYSEMQGLNEWGETHFGLKDYDQALACQLKACEIAEFFGAKSDQWTYELAAGKTYEAKGDAAKAVEYYQKAAESLKGIKNRITSEKFLKDFSEQERQTEVYKKLIALLLRSGRTEEAFRAIEESKSKIVKDAFGDVKPAAADAELKQTLLGVDKAEAKRDALAKELQEEKKKPEDERNPLKFETLTKTLASTEGEFNQWMMKLKFQNRKMYDALSIKPASLGDVQRQVPPGTVFLEYFIAPEELYIFCVGREFFLARSTAVAETELNTLVSRFVRVCQEPPAAEPDPRLLTQARRLYQVLIEPVEDIVDRYETVVIVPFGALYYLPFHALVKETAGRSEYLIERKRIAYTTSATFADILKDQARGHKTFLAFGNPDGSLPGATKELQTLRDTIFKSDARIFTAGEATKDAFFKQAKSADILHLATHGVLATNPLESYLLFAGPSKESQELTLLEVAGYTALRDRNSLVFLSACQTAKEAVKSGSGSELITLAEAFAMAGAPTLIATLWEVEDQATQLFAETFYDQLANKNKDKLDALRAGQIALIRSAEFSHPFYWASFLLIGSWR